MLSRTGSGNALSRGSTPQRSIVPGPGLPAVPGTGITVPVTTVDVSTHAWKWGRLFRDVVAKRAVEQHIAKKKRKAQGGRQRRTVNFANLSCCQENTHLVSNYNRAEKEFNALLSEFRGIARARDEEVKQLSSEIAALRQQLREQDAVLDRAMDHPTSMGSAGWGLEVQSLLSQLVTQRKEIEDVRGQIVSSQRDAVRSPSLDAARNGLSRYRSLMLHRFAQLHGPASRAMRLFGQPPLPDLLPGSDKDPTLHIGWLQAFAAGLRGLQLRSITQ